MTCTVLPLPAWTAWAVYLALVAYLAAPIWRGHHRNRRNRP